jgi:hypothetical protein
VTTKIRCKAPNAEWVLMYPRGLGRRQITELVTAASATVGYHLGVARKLDPGLQAEHEAAAGKKPSKVAVQGPGAHAAAGDFGAGDGTLSVKAQRKRIRTQPGGVAAA